MKIIYDNIIFVLQRAGGISVYWAELIKRLQNKDIVTYFDYFKRNCKGLD